MSEKEMRKMSKQDSVIRTMDLSAKFGTIRANKSQRLTPDQYADHPEKRTPVAFEILSSETEFLRVLKSLHDVYLLPLKSALASKRLACFPALLHAGLSVSLPACLPACLPAFIPRYSCIISSSIFSHVKCLFLNLYL